MPPRTRVPTTGDAAPEPNAPNPKPTSDTVQPGPGKRSRRTAQVQPNAAESNSAESPSPAGEQHAMRAPSEPSAPTPAVQAELSPEELARALRAMANELERDPSFAHRITEAIREPALPRPPSRQSSRRSRSQARAAAPAGEETTATAVPDTAKTTKASKPKSSEGFQPRVVEGAAPELGVGIPDPFMLRERLGEDGFRRALDDLRLGTLRAMVREYRLDPEGAAVRGNDAAKLRALILERTASR